MNIKCLYLQVVFLDGSGDKKAATGAGADFNPEFVSVCSVLSCLCAMFPPPSFLCSVVVLAEVNQWVLDLELLCSLVCNDYGKLAYNNIYNFEKWRAFPSEGWYLGSI